MIGSWANPSRGYGHHPDIRPDGAGGLKICHIFCFASVTVLFVFLLAIGWEFGIEGIVEGFLGVGHKEQTAHEQWELILLATMLAALALIVPVLMALKINAQRREAQREVARTAHILTTTFDSMSRGIAVHDADLNLVAFNQRFVDLLDFPPGFFRLGMPYEELARFKAERGDYGPGDVDEQVRKRVLVRRERKPNRKERTWPDGRVILIRRDPLPDGGYVATFTDITERKRAEAINTRLGRIVEQSVNEVYMFDAETLRFIQVNRGARENLGYSMKELRELTPLDIKPDYTEESFEELISPLRNRTSDQIAFETIHKRKDGSVYDVEVRLQLMHTETPPLFAAIISDITERKRSETEIAEKSALLEMTFENMSQGITVFDAGLNLVAFNQKYIDLRGYPPGFIHLGKSFEKIARFRAERGDYGSIDPDELVKKRAAAARDGKPWHGERSRPGGCVVSIQREPLPGGGIVTTFADITERKRADEVIAEKSELLETTFENMSQGISVYDADLKLVAFNRNYVDLWRFPPGFVRLGMAFEEISRFKAERGDYGPGEAETLVKESVAAMGDGKALQTEYTAPNGDVFVVWRAPMPGGGIINTFTDITERKRAEEALRESEEWHALAAAGANDGLWDWNIPTNESYFSPRWKQIRGYEVDELKNVRPTFTDALHPDDKDRVIAAVRAHLEKRVPYDIEFRLRHKGGHHVWVRSKGQAIWDEHGNPRRMAGSISDITPRRQAAEAMREAKEQAELANRAKSEFLANMSHELRTPLNAVLGFSELMSNATLGPLGHPKYEEYTRDINDSGRHLLALIDDILDLAKIEAGKIELDEEDIDVAKAIRSCMVLVKERAKDGGVKLQTDIPQELPALHADARTLKQILVNLLSNAVKFTPAGGEVTLKTWSRRDSGYVFQVIDTGIGIALADIPTALSPFGQVDGALSRKYTGTGLGLPLTKSLIEMHGGSLNLQSEQGAGTTVTVRFPSERIVRLAKAARTEPPAA